MTKTAQQRIIEAISRHGGLHFDSAAATLSRARTLEFFKHHL